MVVYGPDVGVIGTWSYAGCPAGSTVVGGGVGGSWYQYTPVAPLSVPNGNGWGAYAVTLPAGGIIQAQALCLPQ